jgi:hypothetical protein
MAVRAFRGPAGTDPMFIQASQQVTLQYKYNTPLLVANFIGDVIGHEFGRPYFQQEEE